MWVGLDRIKLLASPEDKGEFLLPDCLAIGTRLFPAFELKLKHHLFLGLICLQTGTTPSHHWLSWVSRFLTRFEDLRTRPPPQLCKRIPYNKHLSLETKNQHILKDPATPLAGECLQLIVSYSPAFLLPFVILPYPKYSQKAGKEQKVISEGA